MPPTGSAVVGDYSISDDDTITEDDEEDISALQFNAVPLVTTGTLCSYDQQLRRGRVSHIMYKKGALDLKNCAGIP
jgi:hypothetical protein